MKHDQRYRQCLTAVGLVLAFALNGQDRGAALEAFTEAYAGLDPDPFFLDLRERLEAVPQDSVLARQEAFFTEQGEILKGPFAMEASAEESLLLDLARFETAHQLERIGLERRWIAAGRPMPVGGMADLPEAAAWYHLLVRRFTGADLSPEELIAFGQREVARCHRMIDSLHAAHPHLSEQAWVTDKQEILKGFSRVDSTVRANLISFLGPVDVPPVVPIEWPGAGPHTPPGIYLSKDDNAYGADVFLFNFHGGRADAGALEWIYLHEAIPGHHLQSALRRSFGRTDLRSHVSYPGNFEGWACYVEYFGRELGLYRDPQQELGKWEWDLVRSVRVVLDAGIHGMGWSRREALAYWEQHIPGRPDLADREVTRVTNWAAQALSYKVGAEAIAQLRDQCGRQLGTAFEATRFHRAFLDLGMVPVAIAEQHLLQRTTERP